MQYRLRTLLIVVTAAAVLAAIAGFVLKGSRPVPIVDSPNGKQTIERLSTSKSVRVDVIWPPERFELNPDKKRELVVWLRKAVRDDHPAKYEMSGTIKLDPPTYPDDWALLEIGDVEMGLRVDGSNYWRGLDRAQFEALIRREAASTDNRP